MKTLALLPAALLALSTVAFAAPAVKTVATEKGDVIAAENGMTLYTFKNDQPGVSNCYDNCAVNWPPFIAGDNDTADGAYSIVTRTDGAKQWAKDGMPLYFWIRDQNEGDVTGDGVNGVWDAARP